MISTNTDIPVRVRMTSNAFDELNNRMLRELMEINPDCATIFGMHEPFDKHLPHGGFQKIRQNLDLLNDWSAEADEIAVSDELSKDQRISLEVLRFTLRTYRFAVDDYPIWKMRPEALEHPGTAMLMMMVREYAPLETRLYALASRLSEMPRYLEQFRSRFVGTRTPKIWTEGAIETCRAFPSYLESVTKLTRTRSEGRTRNDMESSVSLTKEAVQVHTEWLEKMLDSSTEEFAMGKDNYAKLMRIRGIPFSPKELLDLAERYLQEYKVQREAVVRRISGGSGVDQARKTLEQDHPRDSDEAVERTKAAVEKAKAFALKNDMVSMPIDSKVHIMKTPDFLGGSTPWAATYLPAVFDKSQETVFLVCRNDDPTYLAGAYNRYVIDDTAVHEAYPGHHHQGVMSNRKPWMHQLPHIMYTSETVSPPYESQEGWATYCEHIMGERGFLGSDKHQLTILDYSIWTACRVVSDVKLSCREATIDDMVDLAVRESGYPKDFAEPDVKGFTLVPGYGMCYLVGRHLVIKLKRDLQRDLGEKFSEKRFHDLLAENGNLPFYILEKEVRAGMGIAGHA